MAPQTVSSLGNVELNVIGKSWTPKVPGLLGQLGLLLELLNRRWMITCSGVRGVPMGAVTPT